MGRLAIMDTETYPTLWHLYQYRNVKKKLTPLRHIQVTRIERLILPTYRSFLRTHF